MGISGLLSGVSLLGFLLFLLGIALVVIAASQGRAVRGGVILAIAGLLLGGLLSIVSSGIVVVEPTQVAVVTNTLTGQLEDPERRAGTTVIIPIVQQAILYDVRQQQYTMSIDANEGDIQGDDAVDATTVDGQQVQVDITLLFSVNPDEANRVHLRYGNDREQWVNLFLRPTARTVVRDVIATLAAQDVYGARRNEMQTRMEEEMQTRMQQEGFILNSFLVRGLTFSPDFAEAIEQKEIAQQRVEQAQQEAEQARTLAQGQADASILRAEGERDAAIALAEGQAQALQLVSEQISANPSLIQYEYIRNLADNVQLILLPANGPFLFDLNSLTGGALDTLPTVPETEETAPSGTSTPTP